MILYNAVKQDVETDNHWLPAIHLDGPNADLLAFINSHTGVQGTFTQGIATATLPDMMAAFSSRGPSGDFLKPNVTAPGVQVLAGMTPQPTGSVNGPPGNLYQAIAGTSMSSPHAAGVAALVKAAHPTWTPGMIISAMSTSAVTNVVKEDGVTPATPFDDGAGSIRADRAVNPTLVFDESFADYVASAGRRAAPDRPQPPERERSHHGRRDRDEADGDQRQRQAAAPDRRASTRRRVRSSAHRTSPPNPTASSRTTRRSC